LILPESVESWNNLIVKKKGGWVWEVDEKAI
jgi:hypothetical protein